MGSVRGWTERCTTARVLGELVSCAPEQRLYYSLLWNPRCSINRRSEEEGTRSA